MFEKLRRSMCLMGSHRSRPHGLKRALSGFTLIELLVVISIIALLAAMLLPAIGMIRFSANGMVCLNRQKQTAVGIFTYANDNENELPYVSLPYSYHQGKQNNENGFTCSTSVNGMIFPYVETMRIALCPPNKGNHPVNDINWGGHKLPCPDPDNCQGRSNSYGAWMGNDADSSTNIMDPTHGCLLSQYKSKMKNSYFTGTLPVPVNRFTGRTAAGADPQIWLWNEVWGSTILSEMWAGHHKNGTKSGSTLVNIDGAGIFRTYRDNEVAAAPHRQLSRYEQE